MGFFTQQTFTFAYTGSMQTFVVWPVAAAVRGVPTAMPSMTVAVGLLTWAHLQIL